MLKIKLIAGFILAVALALPASSQFLIRVDQGGQTSTLGNGGVLTLNSTAVGLTVSATVTLTYVGASTANFDLAPQVFGPGDFKVSNPGAVTLLPTQSTSLTLQFTPLRTTLSQSVLSWLFKEGDSKTYSVVSFSLAGTVPDIVVSYIQANGNSVVVPAGGSLSFTDTLLKASSDLIIAITNRGSGAGTINTLNVSGDSFQLLGLPLFPLTLNPGAEFRVTLRFLPKLAGNQSGALQISSSSGSYLATLQAVAITGKFGYEFTGASGLQEPFSQPAVGLSITAPYSEDLRGTLTLTTATNFFAADPAVQFSTGGTKVAFTIPAGNLAAVFPTGGSQVLIQTGTVAERIVITPGFASSSGTDLTPASPTTLQLEVPLESPTLLEASIGSITTAGFTVSITGFSTNRSLDQLTFQFKGARGISLPTAATSIDVIAAASFWFDSAGSQALGGLFTVDVPFSVAIRGSGSSLTSGLAAFISGISITATNAVGTSKEVQVSLP